MRYCSTCGQLRPDDYDFCPEDGTPLVQGAGQWQAAPQDSVQTQVLRHHESPPRNSGSWTQYAAPLAITFALVGIVTVFGFALLSGSSSSQRSDAASSSIGNKSSDQDRSGSTKTNQAANAPVAVTNANTAYQTPRRSPAGRWDGDWSSPSGAYLTISVDLNDDGSGGVNGRINWTLQRTNRPEKMSKIGLSATEYVSGTYDPVSGAVSLRGYRKDDPYGVLVMLDAYRLSVSSDSRRLTGKARNGGKWNGSVNLTR